MKDLRSKECRKREALEASERELESMDAAETRAYFQRLVTIAWFPIKTCPFAAYEAAYGVEGTILVADDEKIALVDVRQRFGRPMRWVKPPEMVLTDDGPAWMGGEIAEIEAPDWWFKWELIDLHGHDNESYGKPEIDFIPSRWSPLPSAMGTKTGTKP
jgi:hypothetical protein